MDINTRCLRRSINALPEEEQKALAEKMLGLLPTPHYKEDTHHRTDTAGLVCPYCGEARVFKKGYSTGKANDKQRYICWACKKSFRDTTNTVIVYTRKKADVWEQFMLLTLQGETLKVCAKRCGISMGTAFLWRHKLLAAIETG